MRPWQYGRLQYIVHAKGRPLTIGDNLDGENEEAICPLNRASVPSL
jgi:hypothetical protein